MGTPPMIDSEEVSVRLRTVIGRLGRSLRRTRTGIELSPSQYEVLATIVVKGPIRLSELAAVESLHPTMLSRIAGKLEGAELVHRQQDPRDGRSAYLEATSGGRALYDQIRSERADTLRRALDRLGQSEQAALAEALPVLEAVAELLREGSP